MANPPVYVKFVEGNVEKVTKLSIDNFSNPLSIRFTCTDS